MGLSDADREFLMDLRKEDKAELRDITVRFSEDSRLQWQKLNELNFKVDTHVSRSDTLHSQPCATAMTLQKEHETDSPVHNAKKMIPLLSGLFVAAGVVGGFISWLINWVRATKGVPVLLIASLALAGCAVDHNTVTEEDRVIVDMNIQIAKKRQVTHRLLLGALGNDPATYAAALKEVEQLDADNLANNQQLQNNWKPPEKPIEYTPAAAKQAREDSAKKHTETGGNFWGWLTGAFGTGALIVMGLARSPLARFIPGVGSISTALDTVMTAAETYMRSKKAAGQEEHADELADILEEQQVKAKVDRFSKKRLAKLKKKLGPVIVKTDDDTKILSPP